MSRVVAALLAAVAVVTTAACGSSGPPPDPTVGPPPTFTSPTPVAGRLQDSNDGTSFEPCVAMKPEALRALGLDPTTWTDVSMASRGPRGCRATSPTSTFSLMVLNAAANETYLTGAADLDDPLKSTYRFLRANACVAAKDSGKAVVLASFSDDTQSAPQPGVQHRLCLKASGVLDALGDAIPARITQNVGFRSTTATACMYLYLVQAGRLQKTRAASQPGRRVVDGAGRIYPADALAGIDPDSSSADLTIITDLGTRLWKS